MQGKLFRKGMVLAVMVLFVGASVTPSISGNVDRPLKVSKFKTIKTDREQSLDLAITNMLDHDVSVLLGDGDGGFGDRSDYSVGYGPRDITCGDFDDDGDLDLAIINGYEDDISVLMGDGGGGFGDRTDYYVGNSPEYITCGDFDDDGDLDLAIINGADNEVSILLNNGNGGFGDPSDYNVGDRPNGIVVGNFDNDDDLDLATANWWDDDISVLMGDGGGGFGDRSDYQVGNCPMDITCGDFNDDGDLDFAITNEADEDISILLNNGNGGFGDRSDYNVGNHPFHIVAGDFDNDNDLDLAITNQYDNDVSILLNNGNGGFGDRSDYNVGNWPIDIVAGDFDNNGDLDLAITNRDDDDVSVLMGYGDGSFGDRTDYNVGNIPYHIVTGNFDPYQPPTVTTNDATGIGTNHATLNGNLDDMGGTNSCEVWFVWDTNYHDNWQDYAHETEHLTKTSTGSFSHFQDGLEHKTFYHYRAVASNTGGTSQGDDETFETKEGPEPPLIDSITSYYADGDEYTSDGYGLILNGLEDIKNKYTATVSGEVDYVTFEFGSQASPPDYNPPYEATFNTIDMNPGDTLKVIAHHDTLPDDEKVCYPKIVQMPSWLSLFAEYTLTYDYTDYISFSISEKVEPGEGRYWTLKASVDFSEKWPGNEYQSPVTADVPGGIPVADVGGSYGYSGGVGASVSICSGGTIEVTGGFHAGVEVKSIKGNIGTTLHGTITFDIPNRIIEWTDMFININGEVIIPVFIIPLEICDIGIEVCVDITPHVGITFNFEPTANPSEGIVPGLGIKIKDDNGIIGDVGCKVQAYAEEDFGSFVLYAEAGGDGTLYFQTPPDPTYFDDFILSCWIGAQLRIGFWTYEGWWTYEWIYSDQQRSSKEYDETGWQMLNTSYLYPDQGSYFNLPWSETFYTGTLIENVFPYANPCISYNTTSSQEDEVMMVMAYHNDENIGDPVQNMEILWCEWNENTGLVDISVIAKTRNDNRLQMDPQIAFDKNSNVVCVFVQTDTSIDSNSDVMDAFNATEIAYCVYDKNSGVWSDINLITDNNKMDVSPVLASNANGDVLLVWTSDADNDHKTTDDRSIYSSFWDGNGWSDAVVSIVEDYSFQSGPAIAIYDDSEAICVFSRVIGNDEWVFYSRFQNGNWGNVLQFTDDFRYTETQPSAVYDAEGTAYIIWLKNKYDEDDNGNLIYDGNLFYEAVGSSRGSVLITNGSIYDPVAIPSQSSSRTDIDFLVGWKSGYAANELRYTEIKTGERTANSNGSLIFSSDKKLSEVSWCFMQDSIAVGTTERETLRNGGKNCNLSFIYWSNYPPNKPIITGPTEGKPGTEYDYFFIATDPDGDDIAEYVINWGDGPDEIVTGPFPSGTPQLKSHTWTSQGTFTIKAKAIDIYGAESEWGELQVNMPRDKAIQTSLFLRFLQSHPNLFSILKLFLQRLES